MLMYYPHIDVTASLGNLAFEATFWQRKSFSFTKIGLRSNRASGLVYEKETENLKKTEAFLS